MIVNILHLTYKSHQNLIMTFESQMSSYNIVGKIGMHTTSKLLVLNYQNKQKKPNKL
jgi:hypothetical protein